MKIIQAIKESWKATLRSGRIIEKSSKLSRREFKGLEQFLMCETSEKNWLEYVNQEEMLKYELCSRNISYDRYIFKGNYQWIVQKGTKFRPTVEHQFCKSL